MRLKQALLGCQIRIGDPHQLYILHIALAVDNCRDGKATVVCNPTACNGTAYNERLWAADGHNILNRYIRVPGIVVAAGQTRYIQGVIEGSLHGIECRSLQDAISLRLYL